MAGQVYFATQHKKIVAVIKISLSYKNEYIHITIILAPVILGSVGGFN
jgi:hypothetical protein